MIELEHYLSFKPYVNEIRISIMLILIIILHLSFHKNKYESNDSISEEF
jgi:hypothetical protein